MWLGLASSACFEDPRAITAWSMLEEHPRAFLPWRVEGDGGCGLGTLALEKPQSQGWPDQGLAASCLQAAAAHLYPHPAWTWSALANVGFPLCAEGPGARTCEAKQG